VVILIERNLTISDPMRFRFTLADRPSDMSYQFSCNGRHRECFIFAGRIVPILNKMLKACGYGGTERDSKRESSVVTNASVTYFSCLDFKSYFDVCHDVMLYAAFKVIRVEPTIKSNSKGDGATDLFGEDRQLHKQSMDFDTRSSREEFVCTSARVRGMEDIGRGVARQMLGKSVFRGNITKVNPLFFFHNCP
jgi:hypothetical protein